jgi:transposase-like protein
MTELQQHNLKYVLIVCGDGLKSLPESIDSVFTKPSAQLCIAMFTYSVEIRRALYTTNMIESMNMNQRNFIYAKSPTLAKIPARDINQVLLSVDGW